MEITVYPLHGQSIGPISTALNRGRLVTSIRRDTTASEPIPTRWASNMGGKTHLIQARPKDLYFSLPFSPVHTPWAPTVGGKTPSPRPKSLPANIWEMRDYRPIPNRCDV